MTEWPLHDAKNRFSEVVDAAAAGEPQRITRRGNPVAVVIAVGEYERLRRLDKVAAPSFAELLLSMPRNDDEMERLRVVPRRMEF